MANRKTKLATNEAVPVSAQTSNIATQGVKTGKDFANLMSALMSDLIHGKVTPQVGNAVCNAGGKLLKVTEMQYKYGAAKPEEARPDLILSA